MKIIYYLTLILITGILSCSKEPATAPLNEVPESTTFSNVVILGNSITQAGPDPSIGWNSNWGMAASKPELDYVHLLTGRLQEKNPDCKVNIRNISAFEVDYTNYDLSKLADLKALKPDLLIVRIGENVAQDSPKINQFDAQYIKLLNYFKEDNSAMRILAVGSFWGNPIVDESMKNQSDFVNLRPLLNDPTNQAFGEYESYSVQVHPSDKGMQGICQIIWDGIAKL